MAKDMDLMVRIRATGEQALKMIQSFENRLNSLASSVKRYAGVAGGTFGFLGRTTSMILAPLKGIAAVGGGLAAVFGGLATKAVLAAAGEEKLTSRMTALYGSADRAKKVVAALEKMSLSSSFSKDDLAEAAISLQQVGMGGEKNLRVLGAAAKVSGQGIAELAMSVTALQARALKRLGIETDTKGDKTIYTFRDRMNQIQKIVAKGSTAARQAIMKIFEMRYGQDMAPKGLLGMISQIKNQVESGFERFGAPLLEHANRFVKTITEKLGAFITSGKLEKWGEVVADKLSKAFVIGQTVFEYAGDILKSLSEQGPAKWGDALKTVLGSAAEILAVGFLTYLSAAGTIFAGIGKIIAGTFMEDILQLPGMENLRQRMIGDATSKMSGKEYSEMATKYNIGANTDFRNLPVQAQAEIASMGRGNVMKDALTNTLPQLTASGANFQKYLTEKMGQTNKELVGLSGYKGAPFGDRLAANQGAYEESMKPTYNKDLVDAVRFERQSYRENGVVGSRMVQTGAQQFVSDAGAYKQGQQKNGWMVVNIANFRATATKIEQLQSEIQRAAGVPQLAASGT